MTVNTDMNQWPSIVIKLFRTNKNRHDELKFKNNARYNPKFTILETIKINKANLKIL